MLLWKSSRETRILILEVNKTFSGSNRVKYLLIPIVSIYVTANYCNPPDDDGRASPTTKTFDVVPHDIMN